MYQVYEAEEAADKGTETVLRSSADWLERGAGLGECEMRLEWRAKVTSYRGL